MTLHDSAWNEAVAAAYDAARPTEVHSVSVSALVGRVLAQDIPALVALPSSTTSAMDGWAVVGRRGPWRLVASALAGHPASERLKLGTGATIATGGLVPPGTEGIIRREHGRLMDYDGDPWVNSDRPPNPNDFRPAGTESAKGEVLVAAGTRVTPPQAGLAAMAGTDRASVYRVPTAHVAILGDEVTRSGLPRPGEVRDALGPAIPAFAGLLGFAVDAPSYVPDTLADVVRVIRGNEADVLITTGGTASGPADYLHRALAATGAQLLIDGIAMRPGHPCLLAALGRNRFIVGLPGNPQAAMAGMLTLAAPLALALSGLAPQAYGQVTLAEAVTAPGHAARLVPYHRDGRIGGGVRPTAWLGSGMLRGLAGAQGVMVVPAGGASEGAVVPDIPLPW